MMTTMIALNKHVDGADCCLISSVLGVTTKKISPNSHNEKISPNNNTVQYL